MGKIGIYSVSDRYIAFLRSDSRLWNVFDNKEGARSHTRKYLGIVFIQNGFHYYIPFSSPKNSDYRILIIESALRFYYRNRQDGTREIRKSIVPIIRMTTADTVTANLSMILKNASVIYRQKTNAEKLFANKEVPKYIENTVDFKYAEMKCKEFEQMGK